MVGITTDENDGEIKDNEGSTVAYSGTATTTAANVPATAGNIISGALVENTGSNDLEVSYDGGTTYYTLLKKQFVSWDIKGEITQLVVKTPTGTTTYQALINFEVS